jgi:hypothetical protein
MAQESNKTPTQPAPADLVPAVLAVTLAEEALMHYFHRLSVVLLLLSLFFSPLLVDLSHALLR